MSEKNLMMERKKEMQEFYQNFKGMPGRLLKYCEILLEGKEASPYCYQSTISYRRLAIELNTYCNLKCIWCYRHDPNYKHILNKRMLFKKLKTIVKNTKGKFRMVHLAGLGEPLLYPDLYKAIRLVRTLSPKIKITTNGTLLNKRRINQLAKAGLTHIEVSIDAFTKEENYKIRGSLLDKLIDNIRYISDKNLFHLQINSVVAKLNYESLKQEVEVLKECENIKILHLIPLFLTKQLRKAGISRVSDKRFQLLLKKLQGDIKKYKLKWKLQPSAFGIKLDPVIEMKRKRNICFTCFEDPYISVKGELLPCGRQKNYGGIDATVGIEKARNQSKLVEFRTNMLKGKYPPLCGQLCYLKKRRGK